jgi:hypothetical protein
VGVTVVRYRTKPDRADENQALIEKVFGELDATRPDGLRYASFRLGDGVSFVHVASVESEDGSNPLTATAAFGEFARQIQDRCDEGPVVTEAEMIGSYRFVNESNGGTH